MSCLVPHIAAVKRLTTQIRAVQVQNGYSKAEIDQYIIDIIRQSLALPLHLGGSLDQCIASVLAQNTYESEDMLIRIIQQLEVQLYLITQRPTMANQNIHYDQPTKNSQKKLKRCQFYISTDMPIKNQSQNQNQNQHQSFVYKTPRQKYSRLKEWFKQTEDTNNELDVIEKSIQQTLERTRKLRKLLNFKGFGEQRVHQRQNRIKFENNFQKIQSIFAD